MNTIIKTLANGVNWQTERPGGIAESSYVLWFACFHPPQPDAVVLEGPGAGRVPDPTRISGTIMFDMGVSLGKYVEQNKAGAKWVFAPKAEAIAFLMLNKAPAPSTNDEKDKRIAELEAHLNDSVRARTEILAKLELVSPWLYDVISIVEGTHRSIDRKG